MPEPSPRRILIGPAGVTRELTTEELREALARVTAERDYCRGRWTAELVNRLLDTTGINRASAEAEAESRVAAALRELRKAYDEPEAKGRVMPMTRLIRPPEPPGDTEDIARIRAALASSNLTASDADIAWAWRKFSRCRDVDWLKIGRDWPYQDIIDDKDIVFKMLQHLRGVPTADAPTASLSPSDQSAPSSPTNDPQ